MDWNTEDLVKLQINRLVFKTDGKHGKTELVIESTTPISANQTDNKLVVTSR